jgi:hypothetical protein
MPRGTTKQLTATLMASLIMTTPGCLARLLDQRRADRRLWALDSCAGCLSRGVQNIY